MFGSVDVSVWLVIVTVVVLAIAGVTGVAILLGPEAIWTVLGPADLGPVALESLKRRSSPNDALAAPSDLTTAKIDILPPVFAIDAAGLRKAFARAIASERRLTLVDIDDSILAERYVQRSEKMRFPDTIIVRFLERPGGRSTVAIYSRSQIGQNDLGVNLERIERWLDKLARETPTATMS